MPPAAATRGTVGTSRGPAPRVVSEEVQLRRLLAAMSAMRDGNFRRRLTPASDGVLGELALVYNDIADRQQHLTSELARVRRAAGRDGRHAERTPVTA